MSRTQASIARDGLLALLAFASGNLDALGFLSLGRVFTSNMTGNLVLLGLAVGHVDRAGIVRSLAVLLTFILGGLFGAALAGAGRPTSLWPPRVGLAVDTECVALAALALIWAHAGLVPGAWATYAMLALAGLAMGAQSAVVRYLRLDGLSTTYVTGTVIGLLAEFATGQGDPEQRLRGVGVVLALIAGAAFETLVIYRLHALAALLPLTALLLVAVAGRRLRRRAAPR